MTVYTAAIQQVRYEPTPVREIYPEVRYALRQTFSEFSAIWIVSHDDAIDSLPLGSSYLKARLEDAPMPNLNRNAGFTSGKSTSPTTTYSIVDVDDEYSDLLANKNANGEGSFNSLIEEFEFGSGQPLDLDPLSDTFTPPKYTGIVQNHSKPYNTVQIETTDINRGLDEAIFDPLVWRLNSGISDADTSIPTTLPVAQIPDYVATFLHRPWYPNPSEVGGYAKVGDEIFWYTTFSDIDGIATFTGVKRGQLRTTAAAHDVAANTKDIQKPAITEWIYLDESATDLCKALITGRLSDGRGLPAHWTAKADERWINTASFARYSTKLRLKFSNPGKTECRDFYEKEILSLMGAVLVVDGRGQLNWTPRARPTDESADVGSIVLDPSNCVTSNELTLKHIKTDIHPSVKISYDYDSIETQTFLQPVTYRDIESESHNKIVPGKKVKEFAFKGLHSGVHTGTQLLKLAATYGDDYFYEKQSFTIESYVNDIQLGTLVAVDFPDVVDDATGAANSGPLKRTMLVVESRENRETRTTTYTLSGSLYIQSTRQSSQKLHNLEIAEYKRGKINIATLSGISVSDGIATGSITLVMGRDYYYVNDASPGEGLELSENLSVLVVGTGPYIGFHVFGPFVIKCPIDLTGKSKQLPGAGGTQNTPASRGGEGYALTSRSSSSYDTRQVYSTYLSSNETIYSKAGLQISGGSRGNVTSGLYPRAPDPLLDVNDGILGGLPPDLSGTSGSGGPVSKFTDPDRRPQTPSGSTSRNPSVQYINGSTGGRGGGGIIIVSWGGSIEGNGVVVLNGASPSTVNSITVGNKTLSGSRGGPGMPGSFLWVVDGNHAFPTLTETNVQAFPGDATIAGEKIQQFGSVISDAGSYRPALDATPRTNLFQSVTRIAFTPDAEIVQDRQLNVLGVFLKNQRDGRVRIHVGSADPSNADYGDMRITQTALDSNAADVDFRILTSSGWRDFVRGVDDFEYVYDALIAGKRKYNSLEIVASNTRPVGEPDGTIWYNPSNGTEWILYENQDDILIRENQVPQGEDLINDLSFARSLAGEKLWLFTRNENLAPNNTKSATATSGGSSGGGGSTSTQGITLTDQGRTVAGTAYQDDGGGIIVQGRQGTVTLDDTTQLTFTVGASGAFSVTFPSTNDNNLGKQASIYTQNAAAGTQAQLNFTYEL